MVSFSALIFSARTRPRLSGELGVAKTLESTVAGIAGTIHAHPTLSEAIMEAAENAYGHSINI